MKQIGRTCDDLRLEDARKRRALRCGAVSLNPHTHEVWMDQKKVEATKKEYDMILSREQILDSVWGMDYAGNVRTMDTHIRCLR